ncbi:MAG: FimV N-terminal domain-containing protein, partial [uncultured Thiotrichaceae bacterium]
MKKQALSLAVLVAGSFPVASNALSLGDIRSNSSLNQPLRAKIELLSTSAQEAQQLQVRLAPNNVFSRVGVDRPAFLDSLRFRSATENGKPVILITSDAPIAEPFVNFLLEVSWPQGQLLKEYTVMLDPPVLMQPGTALAGEEAAVRAEPRSTGVVSRPPAPSASPTQIAAAQQQQEQRQRAAQQAQQQQRAARQEQAQQRQRAQQQQQAAQQRQNAQQQQRQAQPARNTSRTYRVRRGDTLFKVASRLRQPGINVDQMMMALYRANPGAFIGGNINGLKAGVVLRAPSAQAAKSSSRAQARRQVRQQYAQWTKFRSSLAKNTVPQQAVSKQPTKTASTQRPSPSTPAKQTDKARLEVLGKADKASTARGASAGSPDLAKIEKELALANESVIARQRENKELKSRITDLESMLRKKNRLIALRDDQLAQLQKKLAEGTTGTPVTNAQASQQNGTTTQPRQGVVPRTTGETNQATTGRDIQNQAANAAEAENNKIVRAQPPATDQLSAAEQRAKKLADDARQMAQDKLANKQPATDPVTDQTANNSPFADEQAGGPDLMSMLSSPMAWKIGAGALTSLLLLWLLSRLFGRRKAKGDRIPPVANEPGVFDDDGMDPDKTDANADQQYAGLEAELDKAEQYNELDDDPFGTQLTNEETASHVNDIVEAESTSDEDEVLMEANVYIAYGLHQQAESELKKALEKHPDRLEYRHKLLENYFASNNRDEFDAQAAAFMDTAGADKNSKMWREIAEWGGKISPDNKLYQQSDDGIGLGALATGAAAATAAVGAGAVALMGSDDDSESDAPTQVSLAPEADAIAGLDDDLGLDDFDFDLDELENELGNLESLDDDAVHLNDAAADLGSQSVLNDTPALDDSELASTVDDSLDFSLDDLANELEKDQGLGTDAGLGLPDAVSAEIDNLAETVDEPLDFDMLLNGSDADDHIDSALPDIATPDSS